MAKIFISYSRADRQFVDDLLPLLRKTYNYDSVWFDDEIHGGSHWWELILDEIAKCSIFIYLISNESLQSSYCLTEIQEAMRLNKSILPVIIRPKTNLLGNIPDDVKTVLRNTQYVDMSRGIKDPNAIASLYGGITTLLQETPSAQNSAQSISHRIAPPIVTDHSQPSQLNINWILVGVGIVLIIILVGLIYMVSMKSPNTSAAVINSNTPDIALMLSSTAVLPTTRPTDTASPMPTVPSATPTLTPTVTASATPTIPTDTLTLTPTPTIPTTTPVPTDTLVPSNTVQSAASAFNCPNSLPSRLSIGQAAIYNAGSDNFRVAVRTGPAKSYESLVVFSPAEYPEIELLSGPVCDNEPGLGAWVWWKVRVKTNSIVGWAIESTNHSYYLTAR
jgi:hypothetical protein